MPTLPRVQIAILNYNRCQDTLEAIASLKQMEYPNAELVLVDDHSSDGSVITVQQQHPDVATLVQPVNRGFAAGANAGLQRALRVGADFALIINNDIQVAPDMLSALVEAATPADVGAAAPMIYYFSDPERIWSAGFSRNPLSLEMQGGKRGQVDCGQWKSPFDVDYLLGCAVLLRVAMLKEVGLFNERYFFYYEDLDLSLRIQQHGYRLLTAPQAKMWHKVASSAPIGSPFRTYHLARSSGIFFRQHPRGLQRPAAWLVRLGSALKSSATFIWGGRMDLFRAYWKGLWDGWQTK